MPSNGGKPALRPGAPGLPRLGAALAAALVLVAASTVGEPDRLRWLGEMRNLAVLVPSTAPPEAPMLLALGDPGRSARYALESWGELAEREGFVVAAVSSHEPNQWRATHDGAGFLRAVVRRVAARHRIDRRRVYLFGAHAAGGAFALSVAVDQPGYFAAVASFDGGLRPGALTRRGPLERPLPVRIFYSKRTPQFDVEALQESARALREAGAEVEVQSLDVGRHFEGQGRKVVGGIWAALSSEALSEEPRLRAHTD